jgi:hypothetical protein
VEEDIKKEEPPSSNINDWIKDCCYEDQLKLVRKFVKTHSKKESINDIKKIIYLYGREDIIWFCNMCMDLGYSAIEEKYIPGWYAYMENRTIHYPALTVRIEKDFQYYHAVKSANDQDKCVFDLAINYLTYFTTTSM